MKLAILVGHMAKAPGAFGIDPLNQTEYAFNREIAEQVFQEAKENGLECRIFYRDDIGIRGAYEAINAFCSGIHDACIELHFNAAENKSARGTETLFDSDPSDSAMLAFCIQEAVCQAFGREKKLNRGAKLLSQSDRGGLNLILAKCPSVIVEPFFGSNREDARLAANLRQKYSMSLVRGVMEFSKKTGAILSNPTRLNDSH